ncbi:MAG: hypothetical protein GY798_25355 [Hyphomicrobiales bacterium]|nr:hypothetical protein [Hyphomicrobiales bacterium]
MRQTLVSGLEDVRADPHAEMARPITSCEDLLGAFEDVVVLIWTCPLLPVVDVDDR